MVLGAEGVGAAAVHPLDGVIDGGFFEVVDGAACYSCYIPPRFRP